MCTNCYVALNPRHCTLGHLAWHPEAARRYVEFHWPACSSWGNRKVCSFPISVNAQPRTAAAHASSCRQQIADCHLRNPVPPGNWPHNGLLCSPMQRKTKGTRFFEASFPYILKPTAFSAAFAKAKPSNRKSPGTHTHTHTHTHLPAFSDSQGGPVQS